MEKFGLTSSSINAFIGAGLNDIERPCISCGAKFFPKDELHEHLAQPEYHVHVLCDPCADAGITMDFIKNDKFKLWFEAYGPRAVTSMLPEKRDVKNRKNKRET